jgi:hypothetical protein
MKFQQKNSDVLYMKSLLFYIGLDLRILADEHITVEYF